MEATLVEESTLPIDQETYDVCIADIDSPKSRYSPELKLKAVIHYMVCGSIKETSDHIGVPIKTVSEWKRKSEWWAPTLQQIRKSKQDELDSALTKAIHSAVYQINDRLEEGDWTLTKYGEMVRVPVKGRDAAVIMNNLYDKRSLIRGDLPQIKDEARKDALKDLEHRFTAIAAKLQEKDIVSEQRIEHNGLQE